MDGWRSPRLGITFRYSQEDDLRLYHPDGTIFETFQELNRRAKRDEQRLSESERQIAELRAKLFAAGIDPDAA